MDNSEYQEQDQQADLMSRSRQVTEDQLPQNELPDMNQYTDTQQRYSQESSQSSLYQAEDCNISIDSRSRQETELVNIQFPDQQPSQQQDQPAKDSLNQQNANQQPVQSSQKNVQKPPQQYQQNQQPLNGPQYSRQISQNNQPPQIPPQQNYVQYAQTQLPPQQNYVQYAQNQQPYYQNQVQQYPQAVYQNNQQPIYKVQQPVKQVVATNYPRGASGLRESIQIQCPFCGKVNYTTVKHVQGGTFWCYTILLILTLPLLCWIPWVTESCYDVHSYCRDCSKEVGQAKCNL